MNVSFDVFAGLRAKRSGQLTALLCLSTATASNSSSWTSTHTYVHNKCIQHRAQLPQLSPLLLQRMS